MFCVLEDMLRISVWCLMAMALPPKDHDHIRRTKNSCCDVQIQPDMIHLMPKAKLLDNTHNKSELIHLLTSCFQNQITVEVCDNDADTSVVKVALTAANIIGSVEVSCSHSIPKRHSVIIFIIILGKG